MDNVTQPVNTLSTTSPASLGFLGGLFVSEVTPKSSSFLPQNPVNYCEKDHVVRQLEAARCVFVETSGYQHAKDYLNNVDQLILLGAPGSGKTTISLMLLQKYRKKKYNYYFIDSIDDFNIIKKVDTSKSNILVFDDFFGKSGLSDFVKWNRVLKDLNIIFEANKLTKFKQTSPKNTTKSSKSDEEKSSRKKGEGETSDEDKTSRKKDEGATSDVDKSSMEIDEGATSDVDKSSRKKDEGAVSDEDKSSRKKDEGAISDEDKSSRKKDEGATSDVDKSSRKKDEGAVSDVDKTSRKKDEGAVSDVDKTSRKKDEGAVSDVDKTSRKKDEGAISDVDKSSRKKDEGAISDVDKSSRKKDEGAISDVDKSSRKKDEVATSDEDKTFRNKDEGATPDVDKSSMEIDEGATSDVDKTSRKKDEGATSNVDKTSMEIDESATSDVDKSSRKKDEVATSDVDKSSRKKDEGATSDVDKSSRKKDEGATSDVDKTAMEIDKGATSDIDKSSRKKDEGATSDVDKSYKTKAECETSEVSMEKDDGATSVEDKTSRKKNEGAAYVEDKTSRKKSKDSASHVDRPDLKVIFTSRNHLFKTAEVYLGEYKRTLMRRSNVVDLSQFALNERERKNMLLSHAKAAGITLEKEEIKKYVSQTEHSIGFPYSCKIFLKVSWFQKNPEKLFSNPFVYLKDNLEELMLTGKNPGQASALLLTALGDGKLRLADLNPPSGKPSNIKKHLECLCRYSNMSDNQVEISKGADSLKGTFLEIVDKIYHFSHPTVYDAVAYIMGEYDPEFILQYCSMNFIHERVHLEKKESKGLRANDYDFSLTVPSEHSYIFVRRFAEEMRQCNFSPTFAHDAFTEEEFVDDIIEQLDNSDLHQVFHNTDKTYGQCFLFWAMFSSASILVEKSFECDITFTNNELLEGFLGCAISGNIGSLDIILDHSSSVIDRVVSAKVKDILRTKTDPGKLIRTVSVTTDQSYRSVSQNPFLGDNNDGLLHLASIHGHKDVVQRLLELGCDVNVRGELRRTPLMYASRVGHHEVADVLLKAGADASLMDDEGARALHLAARGGHLGVMEIFLKNGVDVKKDVNTKGSFGRTPLLYACRHGHTKFVQFCLDNGGDLTLKCHLDSCLHLACKSGSLEIVEILINKGMDIEEPGEFGSTPILYACRHGNIDIVKYLKKKGANLQIVDERNEDMLYLSITSGNVELAKELLSSQTTKSSYGNKGRSPFVKASAMGHYDMLKYFIDNKRELVPLSLCLIAACCNGHMQIIEMLVDLVDDINETGENDHTALINACLRGQVEAATFLISKDADTGHLDKFGDSCWKHACDNGSLELVKILMKKGFKVKTPCQNGMNSLMLACRRNHQELFEFLLQKNRNAVHHLDINGLSCLHHCCVGKHDCPVLVKRLLHLGLDVDSRDNSLKTPAIHACRNGLKDILHCLSEHGADLKLTDNKKQNCLHYISWSNKVDNIQFLIDQGLTVNCTDNRKFTPLMIASSKGNPEMVDALLALGADAVRMNTYHETCVHIAIRGCQMDVLQVLVDHHVDMEMKGKYGRTPFMYACQNGNMDVVEKLIGLKVNILAIDNNGANSLHLSCMGKKDDYSVARKLLQIGIDVNSRDQNGMTPVMHACSHGHKQLFHFLYSKGACITNQDSKRRSCRNFALKRGYSELAKNFLEYL